MPGPAPERTPVPLGPVTGMCGLCGKRACYHFKRACPTCRAVIEEMLDIDGQYRAIEPGEAN